MRRPSEAARRDEENKPSRNVAKLVGPYRRSQMNSTRWAIQPDAASQSLPFINVFFMHDEERTVLNAVYTQ